MAKEKSVNPVTAHNRAQKAKQIKKNRTAVAQQRTEKFAKRNPDRLQKQIETLELAEANGELRASDKKRLEEMRRDLGRVKKARERMGVEEDDRGERGERHDGGGVLGKRRRDDNRPPRREESSDTDEDARDIPMPTDVENMPPLPRRKQTRPQAQGQAQVEAEAALPQVPSQRTYEAKPQVRNLIQEATSRFVPSSVASRTKNAPHTSRLMEPEELDRLERDANAKAAAKELDRLERNVNAKVVAKNAVDEAEKEVEFRLMALEEEMGQAKDETEQARRVDKVARAVEIEEVEDEDL